MGQLRTSLIRVALLCLGIYGFWTDVLQSGVHSMTRSLTDHAQLTNSDAYYFWTASPQGNIRQRLAELRWYNESDRWNRNVIQSWKTPLDVSDKNFASWEHFNPDFKHILFLDDTQDERVWEIGSYNLRDVARTYFELFKKKFILRSDFFRYLAIWSDGGIWADVDTWAQRPFDEWISLALPPDDVETTIASLESKIGMVVGIEYDRANGGEWDGVCQYVFAAKQGHPVLLELIARIVEKAGAIANKLDAVEELNNREVLEITGPELFTEVVSQWIKQRFDSSFEFRRDWHEMTTATLFGDILVLPIWAFSSGRGFPDTGGFDDPRVCAGHGFAGSWVGEGGW